MRLASADTRQRHDQKGFADRLAKTALGLHLSSRHREQDVFVLANLLLESKVVSRCGAAGMWLTAVRKPDTGT
jgi:hypothetical protein